MHLLEAEEAFLCLKPRCRKVNCDFAYASEDQSLESNLYRRQRDGAASQKIACFMLLSPSGYSESHVNDVLQSAVDLFVKSIFITNCAKVKVMVHVTIWD